MINDFHDAVQVIKSVEDAVWADAYAMPDEEDLLTAIQSIVSLLQYDRPTARRVICQADLLIYKHGNLIDNFVYQPGR